MHLLKCYKSVLDLSQKMETLAREQDWEALTQAEAERRMLLASLPASRLSVLPLADQQAIAALIRQIQSCDQTVREYVLPWQESVGTLLARLAPKN